MDNDMEVGTQEGDDIEVIDETNNPDMSDEEDEDSESDDDATAYKLASVLFTEHESEIYTIDEKNSVIATGGQDDTAYLWDIETANVLFKHRFNESVSSVRFHPTLNLAAFGCLSGTVLVVRLTDYKTETTFNEDAPVSWLQWHPTAEQLLIGTETETTWLFQMPDQVFPFVGDEGSDCGLITSDGNRAIIGYNSGNIVVWDLNSYQAVKKFSGRLGHKGPVSSLILMSDEIVISGGDDGMIQGIHTRNGNCLYQLHPESGTSPDDWNGIQCMALSSCRRYLAVGFKFGEVKIFDVVSKTIRFSYSHEENVSAISWHRTLNHIYSADMKGRIVQYDAVAGNKVNVFRASKSGILAVVVAKQGTKLATAGTDGVCHVFDT